MQRTIPIPPPVDVPRVPTPVFVACTTFPRSTSTSTTERVETALSCLESVSKSLAKDYSVPCVWKTRTRVWYTPLGVGIGSVSTASRSCSGPNAFIIGLPRKNTDGPVVTNRTKNGNSSPRVPKVNDGTRPATISTSAWKGCPYQHALYVDASPFLTGKHRRAHGKLRRRP